MLLGLLVLTGGADVGAQTSPARGPVPSPPPVDDMPLPDYLGLLEQIAPPARQGAEAYLTAFRVRCGRTLAVAQLRLAMAEQNGDPVLMEMIRASALQDTAALTRLASQVPCATEARS